MPHELPASPQAPFQSLTAALQRLSRATYAATLDGWTRYWEINQRYVQRAAEQILSSQETPALGDPLRPPWAVEARNYGTELATVPGLAALRLWAGITGDEEPQATASLRRMYTIEGKPVLLPVRIHDAAQGLVVYLVPTAQVQHLLDTAHTPLHALDLGTGHTPLVLFIVQYHTGDLGSHAECGLGVVVTPRDTLLAMPGLYIHALPVNRRFTCEAGVRIWGYPKTLADLEFTADERSAHLTLRARAGAVSKRTVSPLLTLTVPRGGSGTSTAIPWYTYTMMEGALYGTTFTRNGEAERLQLGGQGVVLRLGAAEEHAQDSLWQLLHALELVERQPLLHTWTEHMSGAFGLPHRLHKP